MSKLEWRLNLLSKSYLGLMGICNLKPFTLVSHILIFFRWLSNLFLNWLTFLASVTCDGKLFQLGITLCEKKNLRMLSPLLSPFMNNFCLCPLVLVLVAVLKNWFGSMSSGPFIILKVSMSLSLSLRSPLTSKGNVLFVVPRRWDYYVI